MACTLGFKVEAKDIDASSDVRLCAAIDWLLRVAGEDADALGFGVGELNLGGSSWVLSRMAIAMERLPRRGEQVEIYTWVSDYGRLFTTRNMTIRVDGVQIGAAVTQWAMIDVESRKVRDLSALPDKEKSLVDRQPPIEKPRKVGVFSPIVELPRKVVYSDIDFNGHANSTKYVEWAIDALNAPPSAPLRLDVNFLHEARLGEELFLQTDGANFQITRAGEPICRLSFS